MKSSRQKTVQRIRSIARDIYRTLGSGFSEFVYDRAMQVGLRLANIRYQNQKVVELTYKGHYVGEGYPDLIIQAGREKMVIELKAVSGQLNAADVQQLKNYLRQLRLRSGLLINFPQPYAREAPPSIETKEVVL